MENSIPLISIVIPVYNSALFLEETLKSVINQTYTNWECILIDDHSKDESINIIIRYAEKYPEKICYFLNIGKGACDARNMGIEKASGYYIKFLDSDDILYDSSVLTQQINFIRENNFSIVYGQEYYYQDVFTDDKLIKCRGREITTPNDYFESFPITSNFLIAISSLKGNGLKWNKDLLSGQEFFLLFQCLIRGMHFGYQPVPIAKIRVHNSVHRISIKSREKKLLQSLDLIEHMDREIKHIEISDKRLLLKISNQFLESSYHAIKLKDFVIAQKIQQHLSYTGNRNFATNATRILYFINSLSPQLGYWVYKISTRLGLNILNVK